MALTVRQVGQVAAPLKQKVEQFQQVIDNNEQVVARIQDQIRRMGPQRERLSAVVQQRQDERRNLASALARLEDALNAFGIDSSQLAAIIDELPRILERISLPGSGGAMDTSSGNPMGGFPMSRRHPAAAIDLPLPYFDVLTGQFEERTQQIWDRVNAVEAALTTYGRQASGVAVASQIEAVVRSEHTQFRTLAVQVAQVADHLEQLRDVAIRTRGVPAGMLARPVDNGPGSEQRVQLTAGGSLLPIASLIPVGATGAAGPLQNPAGGMFNGGGLFGQSAGGGLFGQASGSFAGQQAGAGGGLFGQNTGGGLFGQNTGGGGLFGQNTGGGLFGQNTGGGLFGQNTGGGLFGQNTGGGLFGQNTGGGGLFGQNTGGGLFGQNTGGGLFGQNTGGGLFGQNTGGGLFGQNTGGGLFGQRSSGGGLFGQSAGGGLFGGQPGGGLFGASTGRLF